MRYIYTRSFHLTKEKCWINKVEVINSIRWSYYPLLIRDLIDVEAHTIIIPEPSVFAETLVLP